MLALTSTDDVDLADKHLVYSPNSNNRIEEGCEADMGPAVQSERICVVLPTWVGDACMATPTLRALRQRFPHATIVGIMRPVIRDLFEGAWQRETPWLDDCLVFDKQSRFGTRSRWGLIRLLRRQRIDVTLLLTNSLWSAAVAKLGGAKRIVGYDRDARGWLLSDRITVLRTDNKPTPVSAVDYYLHLAEHLGCDTSDRRMQLKPTEYDCRQAELLWRQLGLRTDKPTVVINSNTANYQTRLWPESQVGALARRIAVERDRQVLLHCGPGEREVSNRIADEISDPRVASMGRMEQLPIGLSKAVLGRAAAVVSTDSGPRHIAVALDRPVITLYGPTNPAWTQTYNLPEVAISQQLECQPCYQPQCPLEHHRCMREISVEQVFLAVDGVLRARASAA